MERFCNEDALSQVRLICPTAEVMFESETEKVNSLLQFLYSISPLKTKFWNNPSPRQVLM